MSPKLALHKAIDNLSESECDRLLLLINTWQTTIAPAMVRLTQSPTFRMPTQNFPVFPPVSPISIADSDASQQLIEERR
ncbi:MAG: hypothetical protein ACFB0C_04545 [Leptolyngbyaceae cyanobacterium]